MYSIEDVSSRTILQQFHALYESQKEINENIEDIQTDLAQEIQDRTNADSELADSISSLQNQLDSLGTIFTLKGSVATVGDLPQTDNHVGDVYYVESESTGYIWIDDNGTERWEQLGISVDLSNYVTQTDLSNALKNFKGLLSGPSAPTPSTDGVVGQFYWAEAESSLYYCSLIIGQIKTWTLVGGYKKQDKLTAGTNISIVDNTISATQPDMSKYEVLTGVSSPANTVVGVVGQFYLDTTAKNLYQCTQITDMGSDVYIYTWTLVGGAGKQNKLIAGTNISITGNTISASGGLTEVKASDIDSESATAGQVLTADGSGGASFGNVPAPSNVVTLLEDTQAFNGSKGLILSRGKTFSLTNNSSYASYIEFGVDNINSSFANIIRMKRAGSYGSIVMRNVYSNHSGDIFVDLPERNGQIAVLENVPRYIHTITIEQSGNKCEFEIISRSNTAFTYSTLATYLSSNYSSTNSKLCNGILSGMTGVYPQHIWFDTTLNLIATNGGGNLITFAEAGATVTDHVVTI